MLVIFLGCFVWLSACTSAAQTAEITPGASGSAVLQPGAMTAPAPAAAELEPGSTPVPDTGWVTLRPGMERRVLHLFGPDGEVVERLYILRIAPADYHFEVGYRPGRPQALVRWLEETDALLVVNGGYFTEAYEATGLVVSDAIASGVSYGDFAGMFVTGPAGAEVRALAQQPYNPEEEVLGAVQSFPLLVKPGGVIGFPDETGDTARRTIVAADRMGRILFIVTGRASFTLHELSRFLVESDLDLEIALNLDGGTSSGLALAVPSESINPQAHVPAVILVYPRE